MSRGRGAPLLAVLVLGVLVGCATRGPSPAEQDPGEPVNRALFAFNDGLDRYLLEPVGIGWDFLLPDFALTGIDNFFDNLGFPRRFVATLLQARLRWSGEELARFGVNSTVGVLGLVDVGRHIGLTPHDEDFGQAFGAWGIPSGAYWMVPVWGPSNPRDFVGGVFDLAFDLAILVPGAGVIRTVNTRALLLDEIDAARDAALDYYSFVRAAYIGRRRAQVANEPLAEVEDDLYDVDALTGDDEDFYDIEALEDEEEDDGAAAP